jgi:hypothetical protein
MGKGGQNIKKQLDVQHQQGGEPTKDEFYLVNEQQWHMPRYVISMFASSPVCSSTLGSVPTR